MKRVIVLILLGIIITVAQTFADNYRVLEIRGTITHNGEKLHKGCSITDDDYLYSANKTILKVTDGKHSFTLQLNGKMKVRDLIDNIPDVYEIAVNNIRKQINNKNCVNMEYTMATMGREEMPIDLHEKEIAVLCKEDSIGNLTVTFMRFGMESPISYKIDTEAYNYLLRLDIISAKGNDYVYSTLDVYNILWKPMEKYLDQGDTLIFTTPVFLSDIDMTLIPISDKQRMGDAYDMVQIGGE